MSINTDEQVSKGLKLLRAGLLPFVEQQMEKHYGSDWYQLPEVTRLLHKQLKTKQNRPHLDTQSLLNIIWSFWNDIFNQVLYQEERNLVSELRMVRNKRAHDESFSIEDTYRAFDSIERLLKATSAVAEVTEVEQIKKQLVEQMLKSQLQKQADLDCSDSSYKSISIAEINPGTSDQNFDKINLDSEKNEKANDYFIKELKPEINTINDIIAASNLSTELSDLDKLDKCSQPCVSIEEVTKESVNVNTGSPHSEHTNLNIAGNNLDVSGEIATFTQTSENYDEIKLIEPKEKSTEINVVDVAQPALSDYYLPEIPNTGATVQTYKEYKVDSYNSTGSEQHDNISASTPTQSTLSNGSLNEARNIAPVKPVSQKVETAIAISYKNQNSKSTKHSRNKLSVLAIGSILLILGGLVIKSIPYLLHPKLEASSVTIGTLGSPEYQADLADYLKEQVVPSNYWQFLTGKKLKVVIDGDKTLPYQEAERRIENQEWDVAFTLSPVISVTAKDNGYTFAAKMFPSSKSYQSALFVKSDSPIQSIDDINPSTIVALGGSSSASSFYMPSYDLYGKRVTVDMGHRGPEILELVKTGRADIGAAALGDTVKANDPSIRIIHQSRDIPGSGIYLSPKLSTSDRQTLKKILLSAPQDIQKKANYGAGEEPDYSFFREIITKAESVQICADFTKNPVNLFCADTYQPVTVAGKVNGWSLRANARVLNLRESSGKTYRVAVSPQLLAEAIGNSEPNVIQGKQIQVKTSNTPQELADGSFEVKLTQARQLKILATLE